MMPDEKLLQAVLDISRAAGERILDIYRQDFEVETKDDASPLTQADLAAHRLICRRLVELTPDIPVLSEESVEDDVDQRQSWEKYWLVDPLDGTREFVKRNGEFTVNIALMVRNRPVLGVVHAPVWKRDYYAASGLGAWRSDDGATPRQISVSETAQVPRIVGSRSHASERMKVYLDAVGEYELKSIGSSLKICLVAEGEADVYPRLGPTSEWDTAAAHAVLEEAGGQLTDWQLNTLRYNKPESILNPEFIAFAHTGERWKNYLQEE